jgi:hypothetical protein
MKSKINTIYEYHDRSRICQGDLFRDLEYPEKYLPKEHELDVEALKIPYLFVLTQDCDLLSDCRNRENISVADCDTGETESNNNHDKYLQSILICPAYPAKLLKKGDHLKRLKLKMFNFNKTSSTVWNFVTNNQNPRYHFLEKKMEFQIPELVIDFKHYYTIPRDILYTKVEEHYLGTLNELFRELLSQRFSFYLSRIGLPLI